MFQVDKAFEYMKELSSNQPIANYLSYQVSYRFYKL